ncbi:MAG: beta-N-acetylhexosaminidase [Acidobacteriia bacterium]|nr:beta-N-acetylhexosaminidase [Terriglobia bacterium]
MNIGAKPESKARDSVLARFLLGFQGDSLSPELAEYLARGLAGVVIYQRNYSSVEGLRKLTAEIRRAAGRPVLIGIDQEGGTRFALHEPFTQWPSAAELGRTGDLQLAEEIARAMAVELRAVGCNLNFAPMLDLHVNAESPVTMDRSFGADPYSVARMGVAFDKGLRSGGVLSCAKHFPGHGDAAVDPHLDLPVFKGNMSRLESAELVPFATAVAVGMPTMMTAHILLPQIDPENPASLSRVVLYGILRRHMGFHGVILADDLGMGAIAKRYARGEAAVQTLRAGTDIAMLCHDWSAVAPSIAAIEKARKENLFDNTEWEESLERIERACMLADFAGPQPPVDIIGCEEHRALAKKIKAR